MSEVMPRFFFAMTTMFSERLPTASGTAPKTSCSSRPLPRRADDRQVEVR